MKGFLVRTRTPTDKDGQPGPYVLYIAMFESKADAIAAVKKTIPAGWHVDEIEGEADPAVVRHRRLKAGDVERLA
jgi:hypothetical protein